MSEQGSSQVDRSKLLNAMSNAFNEGELRTLCFELGIDYEDLPPGGRSDKARELILYCERSGRLEALLALCQQKRPHIGWAAARQPTTPATGDPGAVVRQEPADIFLSYSRKDSPTKDRLAQDLRQAGFSVWTDDGLEPGTPSWGQAIESQLETAGCLVVLLSPDAKRSLWVRRELDYGAAQGKRIFPAMIRGTPNNAIPITIIDAQFVDLRREYAGNFGKLRAALQRHLGRAPAEPEPSPVRPAAVKTPPKKAARKPAAVEPVAERGRTGLVTPPEGVPIPHIVAGGPPLTIDWCWVPAGPFAMGSDGSDARDNEKPVHTVTLDGFWLARTPLTNAQYRHFVEAGGYKDSVWWSDAGWLWRQKESINRPHYWGDSKWNGDRQPVVGVSWYEAGAFARWAAGTTGEPIRLPTEAEWEKGARGTDGRTYPWGDEKPTKKLCNFNNNVTTPVGKYSPAGDGSYGNADLAGNVWEWTSSLIKPYPYIAGDGREDPAAKGGRVLRGGSFYNDRWDVRVAFRYYYDPDHWDNSIGFRLVAPVVSGS